MKKLFTMLIAAALALSIFAMRHYNIEYMNELIRDNVQKPIIGVDALYLFPVRLGDRVAEYNWSQEFLNFDPLEYNIPLAGNENIYCSPKNKDLFHLVYRDGYKSYGLEFYDFIEPYEYKDMLELIYNIHSAEDIVSLGISSIYNKRSSFFETTDKDDINTFYNAITSMKTEDTDINYGGSGKHYVTFTLKNGLVIDDLSYSTCDNIFFQRYGFVYSETDEDLSLLMKRLLESAPSVRVEHKKVVE